MQRIEVNYRNWCVTKPNKLGGRSHKEWLVEYTKWLFSAFPYHRKGEPLFAHGNYNARTGCRKEVNLIDGPDSSVTIFKNDPVILEVIGVNYIIGDADRFGNLIENDSDIIRALDFEDEMHSRGKVEFKNMHDKHFVNLSNFVEQTRTPPFQFSASKHNPYLADWDIPMPAGSHRGAVSSQLLLLKIPKVGEYLLKFEARSFSDFESCGIYQIIVTSRSTSLSAQSTLEGTLKDRYADIRNKVVSVTTGKIISLHDDSKHDLEHRRNRT
jgi:hypothetical protein